ncbi:MAG: RdgB/HAM1 family non-canonical purine NTP pyrophosphatase [Oscillospiraceae bacterium]|nr:RdgB/HAM1 family non-canonical purine NTP pyrophosphatase [Oscillospiraceae bacterium]
MNTKWIIATNNPGKVREFHKILPPLGIDAVSLKEAGIRLEVEETGTTFEENALLKARAACACSGMPAVADDSGLVVDALGGRPGVYSARYAETEKACNLRLLAEMQDVPDEKRQAHYACAIACVLPDGREFTVYGECYGVIAREETGENGFGYDPLFYLPQYGVTFGELAPEIKNEISHRAKALMAFAEKIRTMEL